VPIRNRGVADPVREIDIIVCLFVGLGGRIDARDDDFGEGGGPADLVGEFLARDHGFEIDGAAGALVVFRVDDGVVV